MNDDELQDAANQFASSYGRHSEVGALGRKRMAPPRLTPFGVLEKYAEDEGLGWSAAHADAMLDRLKREGYQVVDAPKATDAPCSRTAPINLKHDDRIVVGLHGQWLGDVIGTHETVETEVLVVMAVPAEAVFEVAGTTPTPPAIVGDGYHQDEPERDEPEQWMPIPGHPGYVINNHGQRRMVGRETDA